MATSIDDLMTVLEPGYWEEPIPSISDELAREAIEGFGRMRSLPVVSHTASARLRIFAERSATWALRSKRSNLLVCGLVALCIARHADDEREALLVLSVLIDAAERLQVPFPAIETAVDDLLPIESRWIARYVAQSNATIEAMGYRVVEDVDGPRYERTW